MEKKTITIVAQGLSCGGAERVASILANELVERGYRVFFLASLSAERDYKLNPRIEYKFVGKVNGLGIVSKLLRMVIINSELYRNGSHACISFVINDMGIAFRSKKYKKIVSLRNDPSHIMRTPYMKKITPMVFSNADYVVFQTEEARNYFNGKIRENGVVIFNPISSDLPYWKDHQHEKIVMTACRLDEQKNLPLLINAYAEFAKSYPEYRLHIFGDGPLKDRLSEMIKDIGIEGKAILMGRTNEIFKEYCRSEMFILSSDYEGMSNSMLEALAVGVPTICTDCPIGGARAIIRNMENGILTTVGDEDELVRAMTIVAEDEKLRQSFSEMADEIRKKMSVKDVVDQWESLI